MLASIHFLGILKKSNKTILHAASAAALSLIVVSFAGCGDSAEQDSGSDGGNSNQTFSGLSIDGYLARATVYVDSNNNAVLDSWEPWAFTDNDGYLA